MFEEEIVDTLPVGVVPYTTQKPDPFEEEEEEEEIVDFLPEGVTPYQAQGQVEEEEVVDSLPEGVVPFNAMTTPQTIQDSGYAPSALLEPEKLAVVDKFLGSYYGTSSLDGYTPQERVDQFINTWRYLEVGNSVKTLGFVDHVLSSDDLAKKAVAEGEELFRGLAGIGQGEYTTGETLDAIRDYVWGAVVDPANLVGAVVGRAFSQVGTKASSKVALHAARKAFERASAQGASKGVAAQIANRVKGETLRRATKRYGKAEAYKEVIGATAFDSAIAVGTDVAYQHGLIEAGAQDEYNGYQTGLAALGGLVGGAVSGGVVAMRGVSKAPLAGTDIAEKSIANQADLNGVFARFEEQLRNLPENDFVESFGAKVARGSELESLDSEFWTRFVLGDDRVGFEGMYKILKSEGFRWMGARAEGDNFTNWMADAMKNAPVDEAQKFVKAFQDRTGIVIREMSDRTPIEQIADNMAKKLSDSGTVMNALSQASRGLAGKKLEDITFDDYMIHVFGDAVEDVTPGKMTKALEEFSGRFGEGTRFFQDSYIRLLVSHPGTSALNIVGWSAKTAGQSAADLLRGTVVYGTKGLGSAITGNGAAARMNWGKMAGVYKANWQKTLNLFDPYMTKDAFDSMVGRTPEAFKDLTGVLPGGVIKSAAEEYGIDLTKPLYQQKTDKTVDFIQYLSFVRAQDVFTKSQEMMYNLDIALNDALGSSFREIVKRPDAAMIMASKQYQTAQATAIDRTLENILSKSYKGQPNQMLGDIAGVIEDARTIPIIGVHVPFGRFFNNVVATTSEYTGITLAFKGIGGNVGQNKNNWELGMKAVVGVTAIASLVPREMDFIERGYSWDQDVDPSTGEVTTEMYDAPAVALKAAARVVAYHRLGKEVPDEVLTEMNKVIFGQLTRQLGESSDVLLDLASAIVKLEGVEVVSGISEMLTSSVTTVASGATRFLEPVNTLVALNQPSESYVPLDVKTGNAGLLKGMRYLDQLVRGVGMEGEGARERVSPTSDTVLRQPGRLLGTRVTGPQTDAMRVFAMIGKPYWDADLFADDPVATNVVKGTFEPIFNALSSQLLKDPIFLRADTGVKQTIAREKLTLAREMTHRILTNSSDMVNNKSTLIFKLTEGNSVTSLDDYITAMGLEGTELYDLTIPQLEVLKYFVDNDEDFQVERAYRQ